MTHSYKNILLLFLLILCAAGCKKGYLDTVPDNITTLKDVFTNRTMTEQWLARLYNPMPDMWNQPYGVPWTGQCDEADYAWVQPGINSGAITPDNASPSYWNSYYQTIRQAAIFLQNADQNQEIKALPDGNRLLKQYKAEARFLRAYYYWLLMRQYGPVVLMGETASLPEDNFQIPRSPWDDCIGFVLSEMDKAFPDLPVQHVNPVDPTQPDVTQTGRITQPIVLAVKSQILLYHASPLFNGNKDFASFTNQDGTALFNQAYDKERWKRAADAAKAVIDLNRWDLFTVSDPDPFRAAFLSCRNLFFDGWQKEAIWIRTSSGHVSNWERHCSPRCANGQGWNGIAVTQEQVDIFRMASGKTINDAGSGYSESGFTTTATPYYVNGTYNMYTNREARFYVDVTFNGSTIPVVPESGQTRVEFFFTGNSGKNGAPRDWPSTGYTARKNIHPNNDFRTGRNFARPAMMIRLAEIYLNYAEALNEYTPGHADILKYLNKIRNRGGLPDLLPGLSQDEMRAQIRLERRIELMFEGHRYWDVRRWKVADNPDQHQGGAFHGMNIEKGSSLSDPEFHKRVTSFTRAAWQNKFYFYPVPQSEIDRNKKLVQFPGY
ncbi:RagB/SusD family nutrient uptake outer membrane protein [Chitinophaga varians]|uniref:RagB/SusD family nutrient uptake outer membrane protein n=1 Tax=Chitinophaga varians TaxID=2202339 RepID=A0A847RK23_9BACT|nr:RagB/SusD family nutrient uptake outer membrane protein [Chitinophaga varians]NLR67369.1 RagB/SusD family nutrient uptake outer membrane protein [Chitinophaga varians]